MARHLDEFLAACEAFRAQGRATAALKTENDAVWSKEGWKAVHEAYWNARSQHGAGDAGERWARENLPEQQAIVDRIESHAADYRVRRDASLLREVECLKDALATLGRVFAPEMDAAAESSDIQDLRMVLAPFYAEASALRRAHLDGRILDIDASGPFTLNALSSIGARHGIDMSRKRAVAEILEAHASQTHPHP